MRGGDAVMVKASAGSRMGPIVKALVRRHSATDGARTGASAGLICMFYCLVDLSDTFSALNVFRYITFRTGGAIVTALIFVFLFGPTIIARLRLKQGKGQPIRHRRSASHLVTKKGTPTMGGLMILSGLVVSTVLWANPAIPMSGSCSA